MADTTKPAAFKPRLFSDKTKSYLDIDVQQKGITFQVWVDTLEVEAYHSAEWQAPSIVDT
ncbi:Uncharacterised protein [Halioglobus japonicus]|nr:Uncharacterised protein [Halioglobus japonicus]